MERAEAVLRAHLPDAVSKRIEAGLVEFVSEIRVCTILFIGFPSLKVLSSCDNGCGCTYKLKGNDHMLEGQGVEIDILPGALAKSQP